MNDEAVIAKFIKQYVEFVSICDSEHGGESEAADKLRDEMDEAYKQVDAPTLNGLGVAISQRKMVVWGERSES